MSPTLPSVVQRRQQRPPATPPARRSRPPPIPMTRAEADRIRAPVPRREPRDHAAAAPDL